MAAFSYHPHLPFGALDPSSYLPNPAHFDLPLPPPAVPLPPLHHHQAGDLTGAAPSASWLPCYYPVGTPTLSARTGAPAPTHVAAAAAESSSSLSSGGRTVPSGDHCRVASSSSSSAQLSEVASRAPSPMEKKRKERQQWSSGSAHPDDAKEAGSMKQRKRSTAAREAAEVKKKAIQEAPSGYIHVRARRGQATDSHSLAERARREKISERMKMLQGLVPGCDKVVGKALMLDEIINYVQSLQHQVEFLSMKLASVNPMLYESSFDLEFMNGYGTEKLEGTSPAPLSVQPASHIQSTAFVETTNNCPVQDTSVSYLLHGQGPNAFPQDNGSSFVMQLGDTRQTFLNQENMCSFQ